MKMDIHLSMDEAALAPFRAAWSRACNDTQAPLAQLAADARDHHARLRTEAVPGFLRGHIDLIPELAELLTDPDWHIEDGVRDAFAGALAYFVDPADLIPDSNPKFGLLDDAIVIELALAENRQEWLAWQEFAAMRVGFPALGAMDRRRWLELRRELPRALAANQGSFVESRFAPEDRRSRYRMFGDLPRIDMH